MDKQSRDLERWKKIKSRGPVNYIAKIGLAYYGLAFFLIWAFLVPFVDSNYTFNFVYKDTFITRLVVFGIMSILFGMVMGYISWKHYQNKYGN